MPTGSAVSPRYAGPIVPPGSSRCVRICSATRTAVAAESWLADKARRKTINPRYTSYGLKHLAEKEVGYITNGAFIAAAIHCGFAYRIHPDSPNPSFGISEKSLRPARVGR